MSFSDENPEFEAGNFSAEIESLKYDERGLVPAIVQDARTLEVLTLAFMNAESLRRTIESKETWFWSRSRSQLWHKGATSGNTQRVVGIKLDCDGDALVILVEPAGPACHKGARSCFHNRVEGAPHAPGESDAELNEADAPSYENLGETLEALYALIESRRKRRPDKSYTTYLFNEGLDKILKKVGEETAETIIAAKNEDAARLVSETADLLYHLLVLMVERGVKLDEISAELKLRRGPKGANESD
ncbi:MAG TPA: bifunctional phosphoribosyl-AMP cyclohydrolase/phosphoribosyl-ATP diphosphatase HisIE [Pyrinomonadaceae bacterium]|nr:bifunctional phosphoribosyl-AMP cyclohydrolase/phosphoribosyl-ATP diphosphatase HisIE [Pyrinomonadaceae bacterium]